MFGQFKIHTAFTEPNSLAVCPFSTGNHVYVGPLSKKAFSPPLFA